jgi:hypothetical protein
LDFGPERSSVFVYTSPDLSYIRGEIYPVVIDKMGVLGVGLYY